MMHEYLAANPDLANKINQLIMDVLGTALLALVGFVATGVRLWIKGMNSSWKQKLAYRFVAYAEQKFEKEATGEKLDYVVAEMVKKYPNLKTEELHHLVEEAVVELKSKLGGTYETTVIAAPVAVVKPDDPSGGPAAG